LPITEREKHCEGKEREVRSRARGKKEESGREKKSEREKRQYI
jgi:hypothetical protein